MRNSFGQTIPDPADAPPEPYVFQPYPSTRHNQRTGKSIVVHNEAEDRALGDDWSDTAPETLPDASMECPSCQALMAEKAEKQAQFDASWRGLVAENQTLRETNEALRESNASLHAQLNQKPQAPPLAPPPSSEAIHTSPEAKAPGLDRSTTKKA